MRVIASQKSVGSQSLPGGIKMSRRALWEGKQSPPDFLLLLLS